MDHQNKWDGEEIAGRVRGVILEVMESLKLEQLNRTVTEAADSVLDETRRQMEQCRRKAEDTRWRRKPAPDTPGPPKPKPLEIAVNWKGRVSGILFMVFGSMGSAGFGILTLVLLFFMAAGGWWMAGISFVMALGFLGMLWTGVRQNERIGRLKRYVAELKRRGKSYCEIEDLSRSCVRKPNFVRRDLRRILRLGMLPGARMDREERWLILDEETYQQYEQSQQALEERQTAVSREKREPLPGTRGVEEPPAQAALRQGQEYLKTLDGLLESVGSDPMRDKLLRLKAVLLHLFETLEKHPEQLDEMEKFMEYYLPTTVKMAETYREFAAVRFPGENIKEAKTEILQAMDTINGAFEKLLDDLYEDAAFDVITDASVLKSMLAREGMTEGDFIRNHR
ncbi:MAG: hypothetical protein HFG75_03735 [Hungatella sp.]|nr:hypothetical protein [Hungatella sp.]